MNPFADILSLTGPSRALAVPPAAAAAAPVAPTGVAAPEANENVSSSQCNMVTPTKAAPSASSIRKTPSSEIKASAASTGGGGRTLSKTSSFRLVSSSPSHNSFKATPSSSSSTSANASSSSSSSSSSSTSSSSSRTRTTSITNQHLPPPPSPSASSSATSTAAAAVKTLVLAPLPPTTHQQRLHQRKQREATLALKNQKAPEMSEEARKKRFSIALQSEIRKLVVAEDRPVDEEVTDVAAAAAAGASSTTPTTPTKAASSSQLQVDEPRRESMALNSALVHQMLPRKVCVPLRQGKPVPPEAFTDVGIFFSDVVGFTNISAGVEPIQVLQLLNTLFTVMDYVTSLFPLYKVETIGDAYMIAGGLPEINPDNAQALADFALLVSAAVSAVTSPLDGSPVRIRMGLHTGDVMAGVVGTMMPRYCLFGDTVNTASRMESNGEPGRIHCSEAFAQKLAEGNRHVLEERGEIEVKGKGKMRTFWIVGAAPGNNVSDENAQARIVEHAKQLAEQATRFVEE